MLATLRALLAVKVFCFAPTAAEIRVMMSVPPRYRGPVISALLPQITLPEQSSEGVLRAHENTALLLVSPNLSMPPESARRSV